MNISDRLRVERERLGLNQVALGAIGGVKKLAQLNYEKGERQPDAAYLAAVAAAGVDVLYVITGQREPSAPALDAAERVLLDSYRRCNDVAKQNLIQTAALLSAGLGAGAAAATQIGGTHSQHNSGAGAVQIGSIGSSTPGARVKKKGR